MWLCGGRYLFKCVNYKGSYPRNSQLDLFIHDKSKTSIHKNLIIEIRKSRKIYIFTNNIKNNLFKINFESNLTFFSLIIGIFLSQFVVKCQSSEMFC